MVQENLLWNSLSNLTPDDIMKRGKEKSCEKRSSTLPHFDCLVLRCHAVYKWLLFIPLDASLKHVLLRPQWISSLPVISSDGMRVFRSSGRTTRLSRSFRKILNFVVSSIRFSINIYHRDKTATPMRRTTQGMLTVVVPARPQRSCQ